MTRLVKGDEGIKQEKSIKGVIHKRKQTSRTRKNQEMTRYIKENERIKQEKIARRQDL